MISDALFEAMREYIDATVEEELAKRLPEIMAKAAGLRYCGIWKENGGYGVGAIVTHDGVLWHCNAPTSSKPPGDAWAMMHKSIARR